jgi:hypothetical protein
MNLFDRVSCLKLLRRSRIVFLGPKYTPSSVTSAYCLNDVATLRRRESNGFFTADRVFLVDDRMRMYSDLLVDLLRRVKNVIDSGMRVRAAFEFLDG